MLGCDSFVKSVWCHRSNAGTKVLSFLVFSYGTGKSTPNYDFGGAKPPRSLSSDPIDGSGYEGSYKQSSGVTTALWLLLYPSLLVVSGVSPVPR